MDDAVRARTAAREALEDIEPGRLREVLDDRLNDSSMVPGVLTLLSARAFDPGVDLDGIADRAAGVQLIYEGLRLTRLLAHDEPWTSVESETIDGDLEILAADVFVSRGFYLLARTEAADHAVETVRQFGRDQTRRQRGDEGAAASLDRNLESSVFSLAVIAGCSAVDVDAPPSLLEYARSLAHEYDGDLPPATVTLSETTAERIASMTGRGRDDRVPSSATDP
jgi:hypothetical protein